MRRVTQFIVGAGVSESLALREVACLSREIQTMLPANRASSLSQRAISDRAVPHYATRLNRTLVDLSTSVGRGNPRTRRLLCWRCQGVRTGAQVWTKLGSFCVPFWRMGRCQRRTCYEKGRPLVSQTGL